MTSRASSPTFILELRLKTDDASERRLSAAFEFGRQIYNATLNTALGRLKRLRESAAWREAIALPKFLTNRKTNGKGRTKAKKVKNVERSKRLSDLQKAAGLTEYGLFKVANDHRNASGRTKVIGAHNAQAIASDVWRALEGYLFRKGGRPRFKNKKRGLASVSGRDAWDIRFNREQRTVTWQKQTFPVLLTGSSYEKEALSDAADRSKPRRVKFCRILRRKINGRMRWYVQLVLEGYAPVRHVYAPKEEAAGIDPGPSRMAVFSKTDAQVYELAPNVKKDESKVGCLQRAIDRARRANNPDNYNEDGTPKKGGREWKASNRQRKLEDKLAENERKLAQTRKRDHGELANRVLELGGTVKIEKNSFEAMKRGRYGKSVGRRAPSMFIGCLKRKAASAGLRVIELDAFKMKLSQYDPWRDVYLKAPLNLRWKETDAAGIYIQRDILSAMLACFADEDQGHDPELLLREWPALEPMLRGSGLVRRMDLRSDFGGSVPKELTRDVKAVRLEHSTDKKTAVNLTMGEATSGRGQCASAGRVSPRLAGIP